MKPFFFLLSLLCSTQLPNQSNAQDAFIQLQTLYSQNALFADNTISYDPAAKFLTLSGYRINVTPDTHVKAGIDETDKTQRNRVVFACQRGTYITHKDLPEEKHAYLSVPMRTKKACKEFAKLFSKLL